MLFLLMFLVAAKNDALVYEVPEAYGSLSAFKVAVGEDGALFCLNDENTLVKFDPHGEMVKKFGGKGEGPSEFVLPIRIGVDDGKLWVFDVMRSRIVFFDLDGNYLDDLKAEGLSSSLAKAASGWIMFRDDRRAGTAELTLFDDALRASQSLVRFKPAWRHPEKILQNLQQNHPYNPAKEHIFFSVDPSGKTACLIPPAERLTIQVWDLVSGRLKNEIKRPERAIPFNDEWGEAKLREINQGQGVRFVLDAPDDFPIVRQAGFTPTGELLIGLWTHNPGLKRPFLILDVETGGETALAYDPTIAGRLVTVEGEVAFLTGYDEEGDRAVVVRCPIESVDRMAEKYPAVSARANDGAWVRIAPN